MEQIRVAVLDDNPAVLATISASVEAAFRQQNVQANISGFQTVSHLKNAVSQQGFDLYLLDISVPDGDGIAFAAELRQSDGMADIIFVSSREDKVFDSMRVHPFGFIRKSKFLNDVTTIITAYVEDCRRRESERCLIVQHKGQTYRMDLGDILYIESRGRSQEIHLSIRKEPLEIAESMETLQGLLERDGFFRVHKGFLVNCKYIRLIRAGDILLTDGSTIPVSRRKITELKEVYFDYMQGEGAMLLN